VHYGFVFCLHVTVKMLHDNRHEKLTKVSVTDANAMEFIHMNVHPRLVINLYLMPNLVLVHFQLVFS
jgi:hypothetical protein